MWSLPQTFLPQLVFYILVMTGWFRSWVRLIRPLPRLPLWLCFFLLLMSSFLVLPLGAKTSLYVGGLLLPLLMVLFFSHHWHGLWYPLSATVFLATVLLFIREWIRYSPVFWILDEAWGISLIGLALALCIGRHLGESWLMLSIGMPLTEAGFLLLHMAQWEQIDIAGPWFQDVWWRTLWMGAMATAGWDVLVLRMRRAEKQLRLFYVGMRRATFRKQKQA